MNIQVVNRLKKIFLGGFVAFLTLSFVSAWADDSIIDSVDWSSNLSINYKHPDYGYIDWPLSSIVSKLPKPNSTYGYIYYESSNYFSVELADCSQEEFNSYAKDCMAVGFDVDYYKSPTSFSAKDADGVRLDMYYDEDNSVMNIYLDGEKSES